MPKISDCIYLKKNISFLKKLLSVIYAPVDVFRLRFAGSIIEPTYMRRYHKIAALRVHFAISNFDLMMT